MQEHTTQTTDHADAAGAPMRPARQPDCPMPRPLDRSRMVPLAVEAYPIAEAAKLRDADALIYVSDGEVGAWIQGHIHEGAPIISGLHAWEDQGFAPTDFALMPAAPRDEVTV